LYSTKLPAFAVIALLDTSLANLQWWDLFQDPQLQELIRISLEENKDLKIEKR